MKTKLLVIGPSSVHVSEFIKVVKELFDEVVYLGEAKLETDADIRQLYINFRSKNPISIWKNYRKLNRLIESENPTVTHILQVNRVAYFSSRVLSAAKRIHVVSAWGSDVLLIPKKNLVFRKMVERVLNHATFITSVSKNLVAEINKLSSNKNCRLVFFGIEPIKSLPKEKIVYSNRALEELYNLAGIVDEFNEFQKTNPDWKLVIAGKGKLENEIRERVKELKLESKVDFAGWLNAEKNRMYYQKAAIYISLPFSDGTSISLLEAMSAGCIPVVADLPVSYEWIENGKNGVIKRQHVNGLIEAIKLNQTDVELINSSIIEQKATHQIATKNFKQIYDKLINDNANKK